MNDEPRGADRPGAGNRASRVVKALTAAGVLALLVAAHGRYDGGAGSGRPTGYDAAVSCESFVRSRLPAPSTARFKRPQDVKVGRLGDDWVVESFVVADDSAGARARTRYHCLLRHDANDGWQLADLSLYRYPF